MALLRLASQVREFVRFKEQKPRESNLNTHRQSFRFRLSGQGRTLNLYVVCTLSAVLSGLRGFMLAEIRSGYHILTLCMVVFLRTYHISART